MTHISSPRYLAGLAAAAVLAAGAVACGQGAPNAAPSTTATASSTASTTAPPTTAPATSTAPPSTVAPTTPPQTSTTTAPPPPFPPGYAGKDLTVIPTTKRIVALTFDAGANANGVASILASLDREQVTGTFFLTGSFVDHFPAAAKSIAVDGHRLGNHSVTHPHFPALTAAQRRAEVLGAQQRIRTVTGEDPRPFFRFPYGDRNAASISSVNALGYLAVRWTVDTLGWQGTSGGRSAGSVTQRVLSTAQPGQIVLMHVGSHPTDHSTLDADALPAVIAGLRERGYSFVTLDALLTSAA